MSRLLNGIPSKNTTLWGSPVITKSSCRSPSSRIHSPSRRTTKTRGVRDNTNNYHFNSTNQRTSLPIHYSRPLRNHYNWLYLLATNRPKIHNCILISQPHGPSSRRNSYPNPMRIHRSNHPNNCPRTSIISIILSSQHQLRANPQPNSSTSPRPTNNSSFNSRLMIYC